VVQVEFGTHSRSGPDRAINEDHFLIVHLARHQHVLATSLSDADTPPPFEEHGYAMVVADGAGNEGSGGFASRIALSALAHLAIHYGQWNLRVDGRTAEEIIDRAQWFYERASEAVQRHSRRSPHLEGMCSTLTAAFSAGDELFYAHVGHSRAYLFREGELIQLTPDPTLDQRLRASKGPVPVVVPRGELGHIISDAIGARGGPPAVEVERLGLLDNDVVLLCTDGVTTVLEDDMIADVLTQPRRLDDQCRALVDLALTRGSEDDATAVIARYQIPASTA
jgi:PPM family protein phosphatase